MDHKSKAFPCIKPALVLIGVILVIISLFLCFLLRDRTYETTDIANYGKYIGNYDNQSAEEFITSFFPQRIETFFSDVKYVYRAKQLDSYAYEAFLEFSIEDEALFREYVSNATEYAQLTPFEYDSSFMECNISDFIEFRAYFDADDVGPARYHIGYASIGKILINQSENRLIYVAIGVYDGGGVHTAFLREFFTRFNIDPGEYAQGKERPAIVR
ncbi:MAG: hypothetical protein J6B67_03025 [Oscillospiraceae bacterium]|nr:hypothetical protein [Oscillospiraceae bacterium]